MLLLEDWISYRFGLVGGRVRSVLAPVYLEKHDLPIMACQSLAVIARYGPLSAGDLGARTCSDPPKAARAIELLVKRALITRTLDAMDRRRARLELTALGREVYRDIEQTAVLIEEFLVADFTTQEERALQTILTKVESKLDALSQGGWEAFAPRKRKRKRKQQQDL